MNIKLVKLKLKNFKGIKDLTIDFKGKNTNIYGENGIGKTTIYDSFLWLLFNKDSANKSDFNIKTIDKNGKTLPKLEHEVECILLINEKEIILKKMLKENWVKTRGQVEQEFKGNETSYWIDDVPIKKSEYDQKIKELVSEDIFQLITNPLYFNMQLNWKDRRAILLEMFGDVSEIDVINNNQELNLLANILDGKTTEEYSKIVKERLKKYKDEKKEISPRIDELNNSLSSAEEVDYEKLENEKLEIQKQINNIDNTLKIKQEEQLKNNQKISKLANKQLELANLKNQLLNENTNKYKNEINFYIQDTQVKENEITILITKKEFLEKQIKEYQNELNKKRIEWETENNKIFEIKETDTTCYACKQELQNIQEIKEQLENNFNENKQTNLNKINSTGKELKEKQLEVEGEIIEINDKIGTLNLDILANEELRIEVQIPKEVDPNSNAEYKILETTVKKLEKEVEILTDIKSDTLIIDTKNNLIEHLNNIDKKLNLKIAEKNTRLRIEELKKLDANLSLKIIEFEGHQYLLEQFIVKRVEILESKINSKFSLVNFKLFDVQINGGIIETCEALVDGVPFSDVNNANKINAGLDIINTLSKEYNTKAPVFIDNRESINNLIDTNYQVISLIVNKDKKLKVEVI